MGPTPTLRLRHLFMKAFRSYVDETHIDLPGSGLHLLLGKSGNGKTGFVEALAFNLGYSEYPATEHQSWSWLTDETMETGLDFEAGGVEKSIRRGKRPSFSAGPLLPAKTGASVVKEALREALGIEPELLKALTYRPQRERGLFLAMKDAEKKTFLTTLLKLGAMEAEVKSTTEGLTKLEKEAALAEARYQQAQSAVPAEPMSPMLSNLDDDRQRVESARNSLHVCTEKLNEWACALQALVDEQKAQVEAARRSWSDRIVTAKAIVNEVRLRHEAGIAAAAVRVLDAKREVYRLNPEDATKLEKLKGRLQVIQEGIARFQAEQKAVVTGLRAGIEEKKRHLWELEAKVRTLPDTVEKRKEVLAELAALDLLQCPTCEQRWANEKTQQRVRKKREELFALDARVTEAHQAEEAAAETRKAIETAAADLKKQEAFDPVPENFRDGEKKFTEAIATMAAEQKAAFGTFQAEKTARVATFEADVKTLQAARDTEVAEAQKGVSALETQQAREVAALSSPTPDINVARESAERWRQKMQEAQQEVRATEQALRYAEQARTSALAAFEREVAAWRRLSDAAAAEKKALEAKQAKAHEEEDFLALLKSFLSLVFDETLQAIAARANDLLNGIPNVQGTTVAFDSEHETKTTGTLRQEIRLVVRKDGHAVPFRSGCSGGQQAAIELAVDLALAEVIAERTGVYPGWLVLDEPFDGLDAESKEGCMNVLSKVAEQRAIFVVDHSAEVKEMFDSTFRFEFENGRSSIV